tara:strand:+ start:1823 stop:3160 length:1338 start_codon:yes stop_codon:yes gene_type:complete
MNSVNTIAAISTAHGKSAIGIVRVSGNNVKKLIKTHLDDDLLPRVATNTKFIDNTGDPIDDVIAIFYPSPNSYTGEDMLEVQCHGNPVILDNVLSILCQKHSVHSKPGEFTERAFANNKIDLAQAEAVADIINATNISASKAALSSLQGSFSLKVELSSNELLSLRANIEAYINFPEDDSPIITTTKTNTFIDKLLRDIRALVESAEAGIAINQKPVIAIIGKPNVGKSSLANSLLCENRSIVSPEPGTTRDAISHDVYFDRTNITLIDTAGIRNTKNEIEKAGMSMSIEAANRSTLALYLVDDVEGFKEDDANIIEDNNIENYWIISNKIDLSSDSKPSVSYKNKKTIRISVLKTIGLDILMAELSKEFIPSDQTVGTARARHLEQLNNVIEHLYMSKKYNDNHQLELVAEELRLAHQNMLQITGGDVSEDLLDRIFSEFCIGK